MAVKMKNAGVMFRDMSKCSRSYDFLSNGEVLAGDSELITKITESELVIVEEMVF